MSNDQAMARGLGWASLGIGLTEIAAPHQVENWLGISDGQNTQVLRAMGVREIMHGVDILSHRDPTAGVWSRVAGDVLDTALLGLAAMKTQRPKSFAIVAAMVLGIGILDYITAKHLSD